MDLESSKNNTDIMQRWEQDIVERDGIIRSLRDDVRTLEAENARLVACHTAQVDELLRLHEQVSELTRLAKHIGEHGLFIKPKD